jgi:anthranilate/para-aminobenzoate synthase component I
LEGLEIPLVRYRLYQYVIVINHFKDELFICENHFKGVESEVDIVESLIKSKDVPVYPFSSLENEASSLTDEDYIDMVKKGIAVVPGEMCSRLCSAGNFTRGFQAMNLMFTGHCVI